MIDPRLQLREVLTDPDAVPWSVYADESEERASLTGAVGLFPRTGNRIWRVTGGDAVDYLHRMLTQDILGIPVPGGRRACLLNRKGRVLADFTVWRFDTECMLDGQRAEALPVLEKFVIADDVVFEEVTGDHVRFVLVGPRAAEALAAAGIEAPDLGRCTSIDGVGHALAAPHGDGVRFEFLASRTGVGEVLDALFEQAFVRPVGVRAHEHERVRILEPGFDELDDQVLFNESRLESAVSWDKGCYPGQEPVIMAKHRGRPPNLLVGLRGAGRCPPLGAELLSADRTVGRVTSAMPDTDDAWIGLGYLRAGLVEEPPTLELPDGTCTVRGS